MLITQNLKNLLDKLFFASVLLLGIQLPNFVTQYQQSLAAHYNEANSQLKQYQNIADRFYSGDLIKLIAVHKQNEVEAIKAEANIIFNLINRKNYLQQQLDVIKQKPLTKQIFHLTSDLDLEITDEVLNNYSINFPLNLEAIATGLIVALAFNFLLQAILFILLKLIKTNFSNRSFS